MPTFTTKGLLLELRERIATAGMMPIPQISLQETELMWTCMWDVAEAQVVAELQAAKQQQTLTGQGGATQGGHGLNLKIGTGAGGGAAFSVVTSLTEEANVSFFVNPEYLTHYHLKCPKRLEAQISEPKKNPSTSNVAATATIRQQDINAAKMFFEVANGCNDNRPVSNGTVASSSAAAMAATKVPLKSSKSFSHELCRRFIRHVAEIIGEKGSKWDVQVELPPFGTLNIKDRILDFVPALSPKIVTAGGSTQQEARQANNAAPGDGLVGGGNSVALKSVSKPPLAPFSSLSTSAGLSAAPSGEDGDETKCEALGGGSPLQRVLRQQARERMMIQKHGDSYIRSRVDARNAPKAGFNTAGIGAPHTVVEPSDTDSLFVVRPSTKGTVTTPQRPSSSQRCGSGTNNNNVSNMKRLLISHRSLSDASWGGTQRSLPSVSGSSTLVSALDAQLQELREKLRGPLSTVESELFATGLPGVSPTRSQHSNNSTQRISGARATSVPIIGQQLITPPQVNRRNPKEKHARKSARFQATTDSEANARVLRSQQYKKELDSQTQQTVTKAKYKSQAERETDIRRIEIDVLTAAQDIIGTLNEKSTMTAQLSQEAAEVAKKKDLKREKEIEKRSGKIGMHHPKPNHIV